MSKRALITGITGQDGSYLAELLIHKGYEVHGTLRRSSAFNTGRIEHLLGCSASEAGGTLQLHYADLLDTHGLAGLVARVQPDEVYHLAAQSHVKVSFEMPEYTALADGLGSLKLLQAIKNYCPNARFYQASTSELYGNAIESPQSEDTPFNPRSPYGSAKLFAYHTAVNFREAYGTHASNGILFNHESPRRGRTFVTRKITAGAAYIKLGMLQEILLGNLDAKRDWGWAPEYVEAMWTMLQRDRADDYVIATGQQRSVREFATLAFTEVDISLIWHGEGAEEVGIDSASGRIIIRVDPKYHRPTDIESLLGDPSKAERVLGWKAKVPVEQIVKEMVCYDLHRASTMLMLRNAGQYITEEGII